MAFVTESPQWTNIIKCGIPLIYSGIIAAGIGFTLQILGQKYIKPTVASLILSTESIFGAIGGFVILNEMLSTREMIGSIIMIIGILFAQIPDKRFKKVVILCLPLKK